jgi:hypothetical protein
MKLAGPKLRDGSVGSRIDDSTPLHALMMLPLPLSTKWSMIGCLDKDVRIAFLLARTGACRLLHRMTRRAAGHSAARSVP